MKICLQAVCALTCATPVFAQSPAPMRALPESGVFVESRNIEIVRRVRESENRLERNSGPSKKADAFLEDIPSISPLETEESPWISSPFGMRLHPIDGFYKPHLGIDLVCRRGFQFVYATANGRVTFAGNRGGLGLAIEVSHDVSGYRTGYGHLCTVYVREGDQVRIGEVLGVMGSSGKATGIHLHYTVIKNGTAVDPLPYLTLYEDFIKRKDARKASLNENEAR